MMGEGQSLDMRRGGQGLRPDLTAGHSGSVRG
jgi:hypothetical protein